MLLLISLVAIGCDDPSDDPDASISDGGERCTKGERRDCIELDPAFTSGVAECGESKRWIIDGCVAKERGPCTGAAGCEIGFACVPVSPPLGLCLRTCDPGSSDCPDGSRCQPIAGEAFTGLCAEATVLRDDPCDLLTSCVDEAVECLPSYVGVFPETVASECKLTCDPADVGLAGSCPTGELCLHNSVGLTEAQMNQNGDEVTCVDPAPCNASLGFECLPGTDTGVCARRLAWCGTPAPLITGAIDDLTRDGTCGMPDTSQYCQDLAEGGAFVSCQPLISVFGPLDEAGNPIPCASNLDCAPQLGIECLFTGDGQVCGQFAHGCLAFCEGPNGQDLGCGPSLRCERTTIDAYPGLLLEFQPARSGTGEEKCMGPGDVTSCELSYECLPIGGDEFLCARAPKTCRI